MWRTPQVTSMVMVISKHITLLNQEASGLDLVDKRQACSVSPLVHCQPLVPCLLSTMGSISFITITLSSLLCTVSNYMLRWWLSSNLCAGISQLSSNIYFCSSKHNTAVLRGHCHRQIRLLCNWKSFVLERQSVDAFTSFDHARAVRHHNWSLLSFHGGVCLFCLYGTLRENNRFASHTRGEILSQPLSSLCNSLISDLLSQYSNIIAVTMC